VDFCFFVFQKKIVTIFRLVGGKNIHSHSRFICILLLIIFLGINYGFSSDLYVLAQADQNTLKLHTANDALGQAFNAVSDAEKAGGNVTELLAKLNTAGDLLAGAQDVLNSDNSANITSNLENVRLIANQVNVDAVNLRNVSLVNSQNFLWLTLTFSIAGAVVFVFFLLVVWRRFKRGSIRKLLETKPEVVENTL